VFFGSSVQYDIRLYCIVSQEKVETSNKAGRAPTPSAWTQNMIESVTLHAAQLHFPLQSFQQVLLHGFEFLVGNVSTNWKWIEERWRTENLVHNVCVDSVKALVCGSC
jgi:hypothetical protein